MASTASCMRAGMASIATRRRFSRVPVIKPVSSGASSVTRSMALPATCSPLMRWATGGVGVAAFFFRTGGSGNDTIKDLPA